MNSPHEQISDVGSMTDLLSRIRAGESYAQHQLFNCCIERLVRLAKKQLQRVSAAANDAEEVAVAVFHDLLKGIETARFRRMRDREDLWQILVMLTLRCAIDQRRMATAQRRSPGRVPPCESLRPALGDCDELVANDPTPDQVLMFTEEFQRRLNSLDDQRLRTIALGKLQGLSNDELAEQLGYSRRSIERKLSIIRRRWTLERPSEPPD